MILRSTLSALLLLLLASCTTPDHHSTFTPDYSAATPTSSPHEVNRAELQAVSEPATPITSLPANGSLSLSVEQAALMALNANRDLHVQQLDVLRASTFEQIERGQFDPELFADGTVTDERSSETNRATGGSFNVEGKDSDVRVGVRQKLPSGTDIELAIESERSISNRAPEQEVGAIHLTVTQALLRGRGSAVNLASVRQAELDYEISVYELRGYTEALLASTEIAYWQYVLASRNIAIVEKSLTIAEAQLKDIEDRIEVGTRARTEAAASRVEIARREQALITARNTLAQRRLQLLRLVNADLSGTNELTIAPTSLPELSGLQPIDDLDDRLRLAKASRPELGEATLRHHQNRLETIVTKNGLLPKLDFFVGLRRTGYDNDPSGSFERLDDGTYEAYAGFELSHIIGNRAAEARNKQAWISRRQSAQAIDNLKQIIELDIHLAANDVEEARKLIQASRTTRELQEISLQAEQERFAAGSSTALLVAQAQRDLLASQIDEIESIVNYRIALIRLHQAEGSLLDRHGIRLPAYDAMNRNQSE